ncbi:MAG TPA: hypothetical protein VGH22_19370 [Candidatus Binatia bacterium]
MSCARICSCLIIALLIWLTPIVSIDGVEAPPVLTARETGVALYARQDPETDRIATLEKDEILVPIAESIGGQVWYMVRTKRGLVGWVRGIDVVISNEAKDSFRGKESGSSTWSARTSEGRIVTGTWTVAPNATNESAVGGWTLSGANGSTMMHGTWSADKHSTGWNGVWHAAAEGRETEYSGSWSADFPHMSNVRFSELFAAAAKQAINGLWTGGSESGTWSIRVNK